MTRHPLNDRHARWLSAILLFVVFIAGALAGAVVLDVAQAEAPPEASSSPPSKALDALDLSPEQRQAIDRILTTRQPAADSIIRSSIAQLTALMEAADQDVRAVLTPDQIEAYESIVLQGSRVEAVRRTTDEAGNTTVDTIR